MNFSLPSLLISALLFAHSAFAQFEQIPLTGPYKLAPIVLAASDCETITIDDSHLNRSTRLFLYALNPAQAQIFKERRKILLTEAASALRNHINKLGWYETKRQCFFKNESRALEFAKDAAIEITQVLLSGDAITSDHQLPKVSSELTQHDLGILVFKDALEVIDRKILENARHITDCHQFGFCTGLGMKAAVGFKRLFVGFGGFISRDAVRSFEKNSKWATHYNIDIEVGTRSITPTISLFLGVRAYLHFDKAPHAEITEFETTYYPSFPLSIKAENTVGVGAAVGISGIPFISNIAFFKSHAVRVQPHRKALIDGCMAALSIIKNKFTPEEDTVVSPAIRSAPEDIQ
jgi:hypothetical protein